MTNPIKTVTFGEIMLRLSPPGFERFFQSPVLQATFGGGEANVAVSLAHFGLESCYVTRIPGNPIGEAAITALGAEGVRTGFVQRGGDRLGIYFAETGASQRPSTVVYDRGGAAVAGIKPGDVPWPDVFAGAAWFHVTGITPALGASVAETTAEAVMAARSAGARISLDLNYRAKLWSRTRAREVMRPLVARADVLIANEEDIQASLGLDVRETDVTGGRLDVAGYQAVAEQVADEFGVKQVAITLRESHSASQQWLERGALRRRRSSMSPGPALRRDARRPYRRRRRIRRGPDLRPRHGAAARISAAVRGGGRRVEADHPRRLQSCFRWRSRSPGGG